MSSSESNPIGVGIIGAGLSATIFHAPFITSNNDFKLLIFLRKNNIKVG